MRNESTFTGYIAEHPESAALLDAVRRTLEAVGPVHEVVTKSQIAFVHRHPVARAAAPGQYFDDEVTAWLRTARETVELG